MDHLTRALIYLGGIRHAENAVRFLRLRGLKSGKAAYQEFQTAWRDDESAYDPPGPSLQRSLLQYFKLRFGLKDADQLLLTAENGRRELWHSLMRQAALGLYPGNKKLLELVKGFTDYELFLLNQLIVGQNPVEFSSTAEVADLVARKFAQGAGINLMNYFSKRQEQFKARLDAGSSKCREFVNPAHLVVGRLWTNPDCPLWLAPSAGAQKIVVHITKQHLSIKAYNALIFERKLQRISSNILDKFFSVSLKDPAGLKLRELFANQCEFDIDAVRRGRRGRRV